MSSKYTELKFYAAETIMTVGFWSKLKDIGSKIWSGVKNVAKNVVAPIAKVAAPIISKIPHPAAQGISRGLQMMTPISERLTGS